MTNTMNVVTSLRQMTLVTATLIGTLSWGTMPESVFAAERLVSRDDARHLGLDRAWFAQVQLDRARHRVERAILTGDRLTVLTTAGLVHEMNAHTGETLWTSPVGNANYPSLGPAASDKYVAVINGSTLHVLRRQDGKPLLHRQVSGGPGAAPAVAEEYVFVPLISGRFEGYPLNQGADKSHTPWYYQSAGRAMVAPLATSDSVIWSTDQGHTYVAGSEGPTMRFRLDSASDIIASPAYRKPLVYAATTSGELFAVNETNGKRAWKYSTGFPIERAPAAVGDRVYVTTEEPALHAVDATTGLAAWIAPNVIQFAAASRQRVYGFDDLRALVVLDAKSGAVLHRMPTDGTANALVNDQTDRLYLISSGGLVQCLHEIGATKALDHNSQPREAPPAPNSEPGVTTPGETPAADETEPPPDDGTVPPADDESDPFGELGDDAPADTNEPPDEPAEGEPADDDNPFGF